MTFTKVRGRGVTTTDNYTVGVITATKFVGPITGGGGDIQVGVLTTTQLDLNGNGDVSGNLVVHGNLTANGDFTTLNTTLREVELLHVDTNSSATAGIITQRGSGDILNLFDTTTEVMTVVDGGRVGIGLTNPTAKLEVHNVSNIEVLRIKDTHFNKYLTIRGGGSPNRMVIDSYEGGGGGADIDLASNGSTKVRIKSDGKVGINSTVPTNSLDINAAAGVGIKLLNTTTNNSVYFTSEASDKIQFNVGGGTGSYAWVAAGAEKLTLTTAGNLGINTTVPAEKLSVAVPGNQRQNIAKFEHIGQQNFFIQGQWGSTDIGGANGTLLYGSATVALRAATSGPAHLVNLANGKIGIGTVTPESGQLQVIGNGYHQINISAHKTANANRGGGISFLNYEGDRTSVFQTYASNSSNTIYYGSADSSARGVQYHNFYVNPSRTATTNHALALRIDSSGHITPGAAGTQNLGSTSKEWGDVFLASDKALKLGNSQIGDLYVGSDNVTYLRNSTGQMVIRAAGDIYISDYSGNHRAGFRDNSSVDLYYDIENNATAKLSTTAKGISVHGELAASQDYPNFRPAFDFNFAGVKKLDPRITYYRTGPASYTDEFGKVVIVSRDTPRFDHEPATRESKGLLIEDSRINQWLQSETLAAYVTGGALQQSTLTNAGTSTKDPAGEYNATKMAATAQGGAHSFYKNFTSGSNGNNHTFSVWVKAAGVDYARIYVDSVGGNLGGPGVTFSTKNTWNLSASGVGTQVATSVVEYPNGWWRLSVTGSFSNRNDYYCHVDLEGGEGDISFTGNGSNGMYVWGAQFELGVYPTSYIPTRGTSRTRGNEYMQIEGSDISDLYNTLEGTLVAEWIGKESEANQNLVSFHKDLGQVERIELRSTASNTAKVRFEVVTGSSSTVSDSSISHGGIGDNTKAAFGFKKDDYAFSVNGSAVATDSSGNMPSDINSLMIGRAAWGTSWFDGYVKRISYYPKRLSDNQLITLSS